MDLAETIKLFYLKNYYKLPESKQFHLASRLMAWDGSAEAKNILLELEPYMLNENPRKILAEELSSPLRKVYGYKFRKEYFGKYPTLFGIHESLFKIRHWKEIYGIDARDDLLKLAGEAKIERLYRSLSDDYESIRALSRFALDFIYLYERYYGTGRRFDPEILLTQDRFYDLKDTVQAHLFIYLYTHAIIAESNFYINTLPERRVPMYLRMIEELEPFIAARRDIKFDNQFEYLVANRICGRLSPLSNQIWEKAANSLSAEGSFIVDQLNRTQHPSLNVFSGSEHRNVLFIMSTQPYAPHSTRVK